jgi:hypothetical protein
MATVAHALPDLSNDNFLTVASLLGRDDLATALRVSEAWNAVLEGSEHLWPRCANAFGHPSRTFRRRCGRWQVVKQRWKKLVRRSGCNLRR